MRHLNCMTQYTRQQMDGVRNPQIDIKNRKPYRTKAQKNVARVDAKKGKDGVFRSKAPVSYH